MILLARTTWLSVCLLSLWCLFSSNDAAVPLFKDRSDSLNHLYRWDNEAIGDKRPVIILPGRIQETQRNPWWQKFRRAVERDPLIRESYVFLVFHYDSTGDSQELNASFKSELKAFLSDYPAVKRPIFISYSLGGLILQDVLLSEPALMDKSLLSIAMGVPFHGSPMFNPRWWNGVKSHPSPIRRRWERAVYWTYMHDKPNLVDAMHWDAFDQSQSPLALRESLSDLPYYSKAQQKRFRRKLWVYAANVDNAEIPRAEWGAPKAEQFVRAAYRLPKKLLGYVLPAQGLTTHGVFYWNSQRLAQLPAAVDSLRLTGVYRYNDGVMPLSSSLYLEGRENPYSEGLQALVSQSHLCGVRLFLGIDHVDLGHYRFPPQRLLVKDSRHPEQGRRSPIQWLIYDLKRWSQPLKAKERIASSEFCEAY